MKNERLNLTRRQKIRLKAWMRLGVLLVLVTGIVLVLVLANSRVQYTREQEALAAQLAAEQTAADAAAAEAAAQAEKERLPDVDLDAWYMTLVNYDNRLDAGFAPELADIENDQQFDARAAIHLKALMQAARDAGYTVYFCSGYRDYDIQSIIYWRHIDDFTAEGMTEEEAHAKTLLSVNYPGASEHQLGLAADILEYEDQPMEPYIGGSGLMLWLEEHCADYGFVIRYPADKTDITGISYEPWHLRYVGGEAAQYMMENGLCLEEFLALYE